MSKILDGFQRKSLKDFEAGITAYQEGEFSAARSLFESCVNEDSNDPASAIYLEECQRLEEKSPRNWQGVLRLAQK